VEESESWENNFGELLLPLRLELFKDIIKKLMRIIALFLSQGTQKRKKKKIFHQKRSDRYKYYV
jgi:hypothetical protein